jgi:general stress protein 26
MGDTKNLFNQEAIKKIKEITDKTSMCLFCTNLGDAPFDTRPMGTQDVDDEGNLWFLSSKSSNKNQDIKQDDNVQLLYTVDNHATFMSVFGKASVYTDKDKIEKLWEPLAKAWFTEGKDDPDLSVIKVQPLEGYYWDTKDGKIVSFAKIAVAAVTGKTMDGGIEGRMQL